MPGVTYHWLHGDFGRFVGELRRGKLSARAALTRAAGIAWLALRSYHLTFDWRDPLPALHMFWNRYVKNPFRRRLPVARAVPR